MSLYPQVLGMSFEQQTSIALSNFGRRMLALENTAGRIGPGAIGGSSGNGMITPGSISAPDVAAGSIGADRLSVTTLDALSSNLGTITAGNLTLTGSTINNYIRVGGPVPGAPQIQLDSTGLRGQAADGSDQFRMDATTGIFTAKGIIQAQPGSSAPWGTPGFQVGAGNLANDPSFEGDVAGTTSLTAWQTFNANAIITSYAGTSMPAFHLDKVVRLTSTATATIQLFQRETSDFLADARSNTDAWSVTAYVRTPTGGTARSAQTVLRYYNSSGTFVGQTAVGTAVTTVPGQFVRVAGSTTPPSGTAFVGACVNVLGVSSGETVEIDAVQLEMGDLPTYFNQITTRSLSALSSDFGQIRAGTVTGATFQTSATNPKLTLTSAALSSINSGGTTLFSLPAGGSFTATGGTITAALFRTAASGARIEVGSGNSLKLFNSGGGLVSQLGGGLPTAEADRNLGSDVAISDSGYANLWQSGNLSVLPGQTLFVLLGGTVYNSVSYQPFDVYARAVYGLSPGPEETVELYQLDKKNLTCHVSWSNTGSSTVTTVITAQAYQLPHSGFAVSVGPRYAAGTGWWIAMRM